MRCILRLRYHVLYAGAAADMSPVSDCTIAEVAPRNMRYTDPAACAPGKPLAHGRLCDVVCMDGYFPPTGTALTPAGCNSGTFIPPTGSCGEQFQGVGTRSGVWCHRRRCVSCKCWLRWRGGQQGLGLDAGSTARWLAAGRHGAVSLLSVVIPYHLLHSLAGRHQPIHGGWGCPKQPHVWLHGCKPSCSNPWATGSHWVPF